MVLYVCMSVAETCMRCTLFMLHVCGLRCHCIQFSAMYICMYERTYVRMFVCMFNVNAFVFHHHIILSCNRVAISSLYLAIANYIIMSKLVYRTGAVSVVECSVMSVCVECLATKNQLSCCLSSMLSSVSMKMHAGLRLWLGIRSLYSPLSILYDLYN